MGMSLYHIDQAIMDLVDQETGEIADWEELERLQMAREQKIENVACWYKNLTAEEEAIRQEEKNLAERRQRIRAQAESLKRYLFGALDGEKFQTARCSITWRKTTSVNITDAAAVAEWAVKSGNSDIVVYGEPKISKTDLAKLLKAEEVPGAELVSGLSMGVK